MDGNIAGMELVFTPPFFWIKKERVKLLKDIGFHYWGDEEKESK